MSRGQLRMARVTEPRRAPEAPADSAKGWLSVESATAYLDFPSEAAFRMWARRRGIPHGSAGRCLRYRREDLDAAIGGLHLVPRS